MRFFEQHIPSRFFGIPNLVIFGLSFAGMLAADGQEAGDLHRFIALKFTRSFASAKVTVVEHIACCFRPTHVLIIVHPTLAG